MYSTNEIFLGYWRINTLQKVDELEEEINKLGGKLSDLTRPMKRLQNQTLVTFPNGYGLSFIEGYGTYGLEAAVITYSDKINDYDLYYTTSITNDVIGYLSEDDILPLVKKVSELPELEEK